MGCTASREGDGAQAHRSKRNGDEPRAALHHPNPLHPEAATSNHAAPPLHSDRSLEEPANDYPLPRDPPRKQPRHRSLTVVCGVALGYETPEPPIEEHLARIERRAAIAPIHGITANVNQFRPDPVSAGELARCREVCREWLSSIASL